MKTSKLIGKEGKEAPAEIWGGKATYCIEWQLGKYKKKDVYTAIYRNIATCKIFND